MNLRNLTLPLLLAVSQPGCDSGRPLLKDGHGPKLEALDNQLSLESLGNATGIYLDESNKYALPVRVDFTENSTCTVLGSYPTQDEQKLIECVRTTTELREETALWVRGNTEAILSYQINGQGDYFYQKSKAHLQLSALGCTISGERIDSERNGNITKRTWEEQTTVADCFDVFAKGPAIADRVALVLKTRQGKSAGD
mgnify:CR=1 FL=1